MPGGMETTHVMHMNLACKSFTFSWTHSVSPSKSIISTKHIWEVLIWFCSEFTKSTDGTDHSNF